MAYGIGLQKLCMHTWGIVNSFLCKFVVVAAPLCLALAEGANQAPNNLWLLEWFLVCVDGCIDTRGLVAFPMLFTRASYQYNTNVDISHKKPHQNGCPSILALYTDTVLVSYKTNRKLHLVNQMIGLFDFLNILSSNNFKKPFSLWD